MYQMITDLRKGKGEGLTHFEVALVPSLLPNVHRCCPSASPPRPAAPWCLVEVRGYLIGNPKVVSRSVAAPRVVGTAFLRSPSTLA